MDAGRLLGTVRELLGEDDRLGITTKLQAVQSGLSNMSNQPNNPMFQVVLSGAIEQLSRLDGFKVDNDPVFGQYAAELGAFAYFSKALVADVNRILSENAMTPAAAQQKISEIIGRRTQYIESLNKASDSLMHLQVTNHLPGFGQTQIGFRIPRELFDNQFDGWINELRMLKRIMRAFSELINGESEEFKLGEISTTNPLIFLIASPEVVAGVGVAVSWALTQWKKIEEVKKIRAEAAKINESSNGALDSVLAELDGKVSGMVEAAVKQHADELVAPTIEAGRSHEQVNDVAYALRALMARIERGMTVEIRFLPPVSIPGDEPVSDKAAAAFKELEAIVPKLRYPSPVGDPAILLPEFDA